LRTRPLIGNNFSLLVDMCLPIFIKIILNALGNVSIQNRRYTPVFQAKSWDKNGKIIPKPHAVIYSNLRYYVEALSNEETPKNVRKYFKERNPIPGVIWSSDDEDPVLLNPDDIMPPDHDIHCIESDFRSSHYIAQELSGEYLGHLGNKPEGEGTAAQLLSSYLSTMSVASREQGESIQSYYRINFSLIRESVGYESDYWSTEDLSSLDITVGVMGLFGEVEKDTEPYLVRSQDAANYSGAPPFSVPSFDDSFDLVTRKRVEVKVFDSSDSD